LITMGSISSHKMDIILKMPLQAVLPNLLQDCV
jgi:hypothetical protein